jgi:hypothetical protein
LTFLKLFLKRLLIEVFRERNSLEESKLIYELVSGSSVDEKAESGQLFKKYQRENLGIESSIEGMLLFIRKVNCPLPSITYSWRMSIFT